MGKNTGIMITACLLLMSIISNVGAQSLELNTESLDSLDSIQDLPQIHYGEVRSLSQTKATIKAALDSEINENEHLIWQDDRRASFRNSKGKLVHFKETGRFKYLASDWATEGTCEKMGNIDYKSIAEGLLEKVMTALEEPIEQWNFYRYSHFYADSGTAEGGPNNDDHLVMTAVRYQRKVGELKSIGPGAEFVAYVNECGNIQGFEMNARSIDFTKTSAKDRKGTKTKEEILNKIEEYKSRYRTDREGIYTDENIECGYYEGPTKDTTPVMEPACLYHAAFHMGNSSRMSGSIGVSEIFPLFEQSLLHQ